MRERIAQILREAGLRARHAGSTYIDAHHLAEGELDVLADDALTFLQSRRGKPSQPAGWTRVAASQAGLLPYWSRLIGWTTEDEKKPFRPLRKDVYDRLEVRGEIFKPPGQGMPIDVSPAGASPSLEQRVRAVADGLEGAVGIDPVDYRLLVLGTNPVPTIVKFLTAPSTSSTTKALHQLGRLDLSLEQAALAWDDLPVDARDDARARLDYWKSE